MSTQFSMLLVEDDVIDVMSVKRALKELNLAVGLTLAGNGEEALSRLRDERQTLPSIVLLDLNMPRMNGIDFLKALRTDDRLKRLPVVVLTTSNEQTDRLETFNLGVAGYMLKPVDYPQFVDVIRTIKNYWSMSQMPP